MSHPEVETRGHITGFKEKIANVANTEDAFFGWFNNLQTLRQAFTYAAWDFSYHFAAPLAEHLNRPIDDCVALEIGCGGGRLTAQAARYVKSVVGVDIHDNLPVVSRKFSELHIDNVELRQCDGNSLPCSDEEFDIIYSFIVFQHLEKISIVESYLQESFRCLKKGGLCMIYFGRFSSISKNKTSRFLRNLDSIIERVAIPKGYKEFPAPVNHTNLLITLPYMKKMAKNIGFDIVSSTTSRRNVPLGTKNYGGQHGIILEKR